MLKDDYLTRMTSGAVNTLLRLIFNIDLGKNEENAFRNEEMKSRYLELIKLIDDGKLNEAENRLLDELDPKDMEFYKMALKKSGIFIIQIVIKHKGNFIKFPVIVVQLIQ